MTEPQPIATLPPLAELEKATPLSPRTGEPPRPVAACVAAVAAYLAVAVVAIVYATHWWHAAHPGTYPTSARLIEWVQPDPGKWLSLTLEAAIAAASLLAAGAVGVAGFQAWNGWRFSRWAAPVALVLLAGYAAITQPLAWAAAALGLVTAFVTQLPPMRLYFARWAAVRSSRPDPYRRPSRIFYGRLPRFR